ncbi:natural killer cells antigen CD94-like isoform X2 [Lates japonicus]|uniref:Natural killer cells antigen CD94-like isoform X2 n=1 Tax=Lates japonicus TaxID=270547 RepID=A0AAD3MF95_LATJO|nr:natural killer cells antigen CD94-like isoform X2 [Lates japonicus]
MEEELNYVMVTFKSREKPNDLEVIYDEVRTENQALDTQTVIQENKKKAPLYTQLHLVAAGLGIICVILVSVVIALSIHLKTVTSEWERQNTGLTAQNLQLWKEKTDLERQTEELTREKDGLNWTITAILEYDNFPVNTHCPKKVCKPCLDNWILFQSNCYLFMNPKYTWKTWQKSREDCRQQNSDLVVIESQEEQEFISNHTEDYDDANHGYWIGLNNNVKETWMWVDGSNITVTYWKPDQYSYRLTCVLSLGRADPLASWRKSSCEMKNRWICETRALIKPD